MKRVLITSIILISLSFFNLSFGRYTPTSKENLSVSFNEEKGTYSIFRNGDVPLVLNARLEIKLIDRVINLSGLEFNKKIDRTSFTNNIGSGKEMVVHFNPTDQSPVSADLYIRIYKNISLTTIEAVIKNQSDKDLELIEIYPLVTDNKKGSGFFFSPKIDDLRLLCQDLYFLKDELMEANAFWKLAMYDPAAPMGLTIGSLKFSQTETEIVIARHPESDNEKGLAGFELKINCSTNNKRAKHYFKTTEKTLIQRGMQKDGWYNEPERHGQYLLASGADISTGQIAFIMNESPHQTLENWALYTQQINEIKLDRPITCGWSSWPEFYTKINETKILNVAKAARKNHFSDFGFNIIQLDDGFQKQFGDWDGNVYFPQGMEWLATEIKKIGFESGIWTGPYTISLNHEIVKSNPEWLFHDGSGKIRNDSYFNIFPAYSIDVTHPEAKEWFTGMFREMSSDWGYSLFKLDLPGAFLSPNIYSNPYLTKTEAYRDALRALRAGIGEDANILNLGPLSCAGLVDEKRISGDIAASWEVFSRIGRTGRRVPKNYYLHNRLFHIDADHVVVRDPLTMDQAHVLATNVAMSGGVTLAGDDLTKLPKERMNIIKQVMPTYGEAARSVDLFETNNPMISSLEVKRDFENWHIIAVASWDQKKMVYRTIDLEDAGLDSNTEYLAFEFWEQKFLGKVSGELNLKLRPTSVKVVALREITGHPQIIGTNRHITQGGVELDDVSWNKRDLTLTGTLKGGREHTFNLTVYVPSGYKLIEASADKTTSKISYPNSELIQLDIDFGDKSTREFRFNFNND